MTLKRQYKQMHTHIPHTHAEVVPFQDNPWTDPILPRLLFSLPLSLSHVRPLTLLLSLSSSKIVLGHRDTCSP